MFLTEDRIVVAMLFEENLTAFISALFLCPIKSTFILYVVISLISV